MAEQQRCISRQENMANISGYTVLFALLASSVYAQYKYPEVNASDPRTPLYFGLMQSFSDANYDGSGVIPGVDVALDQINDDPTLLPGYTLHYILTDSKVNSGLAGFIVAKLSRCFYSYVYAHLGIYVGGSLWGGLRPCTRANNRI